MHPFLRHPARVFAVSALAMAFAVPQCLPAQDLPAQDLPAQAADHIVTPRDLNQATQDATQTGQHNLEALRGFLSSQKATRALEQAHIDPQQVQNAVAGLSDHDLAQLAARATRAQNDFAAGNLSDHDLLVILIAVAVLILIIVAVH